MLTKSQTAWAVAALIGITLVTRSWAEDTPTTATAATSGLAPPPSVTVLGSKQAQSVLGKEVRSAANEDMGRIVDVIVDRAGQVRAAVIDFGGFLGVGSRKIAVDWNALHFSTESGKKPEVITLGLTRDQVKGAPEYKDKRAVIVLGAAGGLRTLPE
jgi:tryptophan synthase beta subunit